MAHDKRARGYDSLLMKRSARRKRQGSRVSNELHSNALAVSSKGRRLNWGELLHAREIHPRGRGAEAAKCSASSGGHVRDLKATQANMSSRRR